jgi:peroxiredoxin family protein
MERYDLQADCIRALIGRKPKKRGDLYEFRCIRHDDREASAWVGNARWGCHACGFEEPIATLCEALNVTVPKRQGFTVEQYAERKGFSLAALNRWGVVTATSQHGNEIVAIPYLDAEGKVLRVKHRAAGKSWWAPGTGTYLYGLQILAAAASSDPVIVVEGESDCHACWHQRILAVGVPGATHWKRDWAPLLSGRQVYIWQEPGEAGAKFAQSLATDFPDARIMRSEAHKDLADLFKATGTGFKASVEALRAEALPIGVSPPAVKFCPILGGTLESLLVRKLAPVDAVPTPLASWSRACRDEGGGIGLARGWNITVAGNTGTGKSLVALNIAAAAIANGERVAFHSIEMSLMQLTTRMLSIVSGISVFRLEQGSGFDAGDWKTASLRMAELHERSGGTMFVNEAPIHRLEHIVEAVKYQHDIHGCRFHIVDYLQLCRVTGTKDVVEAVPIISGAMRETGKELNVVMVGLSQFNRETSKNKERPQIQGLMGGSPLENDSDQVVLLNHAKVEKRGHFTDTEALLAKNRHGPAADIPVMWDYRTLTLTEAHGDAYEEHAA